MRTKYIYFLIGAVSVAAVVYPVIFTALSPSYAKSPFSCVPFIPCPKAPKAANLCSTTCTIFMKDSSFEPQNINVSTGATITWINEDGFPHTSTAYNSTGWSSGFISPGRTFSFTVNISPGVYYYHCNIHLQMVGVLTVVS